MRELKSAIHYLRRHRVPEARTNAEMLLAHVTGKKRTELYFRAMTLRHAQAKRFQRLLQTRALQRKPLAYVIGEADFMGLPIRLKPRAALIPRPETETLVEAVLKRLPNVTGQMLHLLDVGAGSGCIGLFFLRQCDCFKKVTFIEPSKRAASLISVNARRLHVPQRAYRIIRRRFQNLSFRAQFDVIVANLPYVRSGQMASLAPEIKRWEPHDALDGGKDGLVLIRELIGRARLWLKRGGLLALEVGDGQALRVRKMLEREGYSNIDIHKDLQGKERVLSCHLDDKKE